MRFWLVLGILVCLLMSNLSWSNTTCTIDSKFMVLGAEVEADEKHDQLCFRNMKRRAVTEEEISYIASTLQPSECFSLLYLLHHGYNRRRRREVSAEKESNIHERSAQITPCETMLLNYWRDPSSRGQRDCSQVSRTLRKVKRQDLARWLCYRRPAYFFRTGELNGTNDATPLSSEMQMIPIYSSHPKTDHSAVASDRETVNRALIDSTLDSMMWIYIALAVCSTAAALLCVNWLFRRFRKPSQYIALADKDIRSLPHACSSCNDKRSPASSGKKRYQVPQTRCACSGNE